DYVMPKYGNKNWMDDSSWSQIILDDIYNTFYKDEAEADEETELAKESEDMAFSIMKGSEKRKVVSDDLSMVEPDMGKANLMVSDKGKAKQVENDLDDALDLENKIKKLSEDFNRLLKANKAKETGRQCLQKLLKYLVMKKIDRSIES
ncbi:hypothetical protein Tco_0161161, partial [Tanacetum coccineum]